MESTRWDRVQELFHQALELPEAERAAFLEFAYGDDREMKSEVARMLAADDRKTSLLDRGMSEFAYRLVGNPSDSISSREFGPYRLKQVLGEGGMGVVWLAQRSDAGNLVAIKFLPHSGLSPARRERFAQEIRTLARLQHPYIARLYDAGTLDDGTPWFVMEYVEGVRFADYCRAEGRTVEDRLRAFRMVCEAVQYAHGLGIIHRDLKPSNIMVTADGTPRLLDFGIARELNQMDESGELTRPGLRFFSPDYAAPEWTREGVVGLFTDVYSLGVILYEMLTGRLPLARTGSGSGNAETKLVAHAIEKPSTALGKLPEQERAANPAAQLSKGAWSDLDVMCLKAMHQDPKARYQTVEALLRDVNHFLSSEPLEARPDRLLYRAGKFVRRNRAAVLATAAALILIAGMAAFFTTRLIQTRAVALAEAARRERVQSFMLDLFQGGDKDAGPSEDLRVITLIDRGAAGAQSLSREPAVQADLYQTLGTMYQKLGRFDRAESLLESELQTRHSLPSPDWAGEADNLLALGLLRAEQGNKNEAEKLVREALAGIQKNDPGNKKLLAEAQADLGSVLVDAGKYSDSVPILQQAIAIMRSTSSVQPAELARTLGSLADANMYLGNYDQCQRLNLEALAIDRQVYGNNHPHIGDDLGNLAQIEETRGHFEEAVQHERQALEIMRAWYGDQHPETARKMTTLASTLTDVNRQDEADELLRQALAIQLKAYGPMHPRVAYVLNSMGTVASYRKKFGDAEQDYRRMIDIYRSAYGDGDYRVAIGMGNLASVYFAEGRDEDCEHILVDVVQRMTKAMGAGNINTGMAEVRLGRTLVHEKKYAQAEPHTRAGYETLKDQTSSQTTFVQGALHDLAIEYDALGRPQDAERYRNALAATHPPELKKASAR